MNLRKWSSNVSELLEDIDPNHLSNTELMNFNTKICIKTLGMIWVPRHDVFTFRLNLPLDSSPTKRGALSTIARLFDPLGLITPILVCGKLILKNIWQTKVATDQATNSVDWDDPLPQATQKQLQLFYADLKQLGILSIPRWTGFHPNEVTSLQLHTFCDGSSKAYAAAVYLRLRYSNGKVSTNLVVAKGRVTPIKPLSIPRVELCGAVLAAQLGNWVHKRLHTNLHITMHYWTDAEIVLHWIRGGPSRWKVYVSNRIAKILQTSDAGQWGYVNTLDNPADCGTRGIGVTQLAKSDLWWKGPSWLAKNEGTWPKFRPVNTVSNTDSEEVSRPPQSNVARVDTDAIIYRYSSLGKLQRVIAYVLRFARNARSGNPMNREVKQLTVQELKHSLTLVIKLVQQDEFSPEIKDILAKRSISSSSRLRSLTPWLDADNIRRIRGRLSQTKLPFGQKHPIILPKGHFVTNLIIKQAHCVTLHGGVQLTLTYLRQQYWIINGRSAVQQVLRHCIKCFRNNPEVAHQLLGDLPYPRVNPPNKPFLATGIDYAGPIELKASKFRGHASYKGFIAIFICMATKAIHLEAVTGLTTEHFYLALQRFLGRRGICKDIYSDCGTNFVGAHKVLLLNQHKFADDVEREIVPKLTAQNIQWHFNPPHSPNFGGIWEVNVKAIKYHLRRTVNSKLTYEELSTVLVRIEACLNSRPLCPLTSDPEDLTVLTPAHFITGDSLLAIPGDHDVKMSLSNQYIEMQKMVHGFWNRWTSDWLSHLQSRPKWRNETPNIAVNELVIVKDERFPPNTWHLGRVIEAHPGKDNLVRVVSVKTSQGIYKRSVSKLCRLPIPNSSNSC